MCETLPTVADEMLFLGKRTLAADGSGFCVFQKFRKAEENTVPV